MFIREDDSLVRRMLGLDESARIPAGVEEEYQHWLRFFHRIGGSGALGPFGCIAVVRSCGLVPPEQRKAEEEVDWGRVQVGTKVDVLVELVGGEEGTQAGVYRGKVSHGTLGVLLDGETSVREVTRHKVRIAAREGVPEDVQVSEEDVTPEAAPIKYQMIRPDAEFFGTNDMPLTDWMTVEQGSAVWSLVKGEVLAGKFVDFKHGKVTVEVEGKKHSLGTGQVFPIG